MAIIDQGRLVALASPRALIEQGVPTPGASGVQFRTRPGLDPAALARLFGDATVREESPGRYVAAVAPSPQQLADLAAWLRDRDALLAELRVGGAARNLEDVFLSLTGRELRD